MPSIPRAKAIVFVANIASLPTSGSDGFIYIVTDDGTGNPAIALWDSGAATWSIISSAGGGGGIFWQNPVEDKDLNTPPGAPSAGDRYIVAAGGVGAWTGKDDDITEWDGVQWDFTTPTEGFACEVLDEDQYYAYTGTVWVTLPVFLGVVTGPASATDDSIALYDGITGKKIKGLANATIKQDAAPPSGLGAEVNSKLAGDATFKNAVRTNDALSSADSALDVFLAAGAPKMLVGYLGVISAALSTSSDVPYIAGSQGQDGGNPSQPVTFSSGSVSEDGTGADNSGAADMGSGPVSAGGSGDSGSVKDKSGNNQGSGKSGTYDAGSGDTIDDDSGKVTVGSGDSTNANSGDAELKAGNAPSGTRGNALLDGLQIRLNGGQTFKSIAVADADHTLLISEYHIAYTSITAARSVPLPVVATVPPNSVFVLKDESGSVTPTNKITLNPDGIETIDGVASLDLITPFGAIEFYANSISTAWFTK